MKSHFASLGSRALVALLPLISGLPAARAEDDPSRAAGAPVRVWTDTSGKFTRTAELVEVRADGVRLRQASGRCTTIAWDRLSPADRQFVHEVLAENAGPQPAADAQRTWTDATGRARAQGRLVAVHGEVVVLERPSGKLARADWSKLSPTDRQYVLAAAADGKVPVEAGRTGPAPERRVEPDSTATLTAAPAERGQTLFGLASAALPLVPTWAQSSTPRRVIQLQVSRRFLEEFLPRDVDTVDAVRDVIVGSPVSGTSTTRGQGSIQLLPSSRQGIIDVLFVGSSQADTVSDGGRAQVSSRSATSFQARKRIWLDASGLHWLPAVCHACTSTQTCGICTWLPGLRGAIARRVTVRRTDEVRGQADREAASHFAAGVEQQMDRDVPAGLAAVDRFWRKFIAATRQQGLDLSTECSSTSEQLELAVFRAPQATDDPAPKPPALAGNPPLVVWVHQSFLQQVLTDARLRTALEPLVADFLPAGALGSSPSPSDRPHPRDDWRIGWSQDGSWLTVSFVGSRPKVAAAGKAPAADILAKQAGR